MPRNIERLERRLLLSGNDPFSDADQAAPIIGDQDTDDQTTDGDDGLNVQAIGPTYEITGLKWEDFNGDGVKQDGEDLLADVRIYLDTNGNQMWDGTSEPSTQTNGVGRYTFSGLSAGDYVIREVLPEGYTQTFPAPDGAHRVTLGGPLAVLGENGVTAQGQVGVSTDGTATDSTGTILADVPIGATIEAAYLHVATRTFAGSFQPSEIGFEGDSVSLQWLPGVQDGGQPNFETGRADVTSLVKTKADGGSATPIEFSVDETITGDASLVEGTSLTVIYSLAGLPQRSIILLEGGLTGPTGQQIELTWEELVTPSDPGFTAELALGIQYGFTSGPQFSQVDVNGARLTSSAGGIDDGSPVDGMLITMGGVGNSTANPSDPLSHDQSLDDELYDLTPLLADGSRVASLDLSNPSGDDSIFLAVLSLDGNAGVTQEYNFGNQPEITGVKWIDFNGDGVRQEGEGPLADVRIYLDMNKNNEWDEDTEPSTLTDSAGRYAFTESDVSDFVIREVVPEGYTQSFPASDGAHRVTLGGPLAVLGADGITIQGKVGVSTDGTGTDDTGTLLAEIPIDAIIEAAYLHVATRTFADSFRPNEIGFEGESVMLEWLPGVQDGVQPNFETGRTDFTPLVKAKADGGSATPIEFSVDESITGDASLVEGTSLTVIYSHPSLPQRSIIVLEGGLTGPTGQRVEVTWDEPVTPSDPGFTAELAMGIQYGFISGPQFSQVDVNSTRLTSSAGGVDDGSPVDGMLITVGGVGDSTANPSDPFSHDHSLDDELYDLSSFMPDGTRMLSLDLSNPSGDDSIFLAVLSLDGIARLAQEFDFGNEPIAVPEPVVVSIDDLSRSEGDADTTAFEFTISLDAIADFDVTVAVNTFDGTALVSDTDYLPLVDVDVTVPAGALSATVTVKVQGDLKIETDEIFTVRLSDPRTDSVVPGAGDLVSLGKSEGSGEIVNDDGSSISGTVWRDLNADGFQGVDEPGEPSTSVFLDHNDNGLWDASEPITTTDALGKYSFDPIEAGDYVVREIVPLGLLQSFPVSSDDFAHAVMLPNRTGVTDIDFGNFAIGAPEPDPQLPEADPDPPPDPEGPDEPSGPVITPISSPAGLGELNAVSARAGMSGLRRLAVDAVIPQLGDDDRNSDQLVGVAEELDDLLLAISDSAAPSVLGLDPGDPPPPPREPRDVPDLVDQMLPAPEEPIGEAESTSGDSPTWRRVAGIAASVGGVMAVAAGFWILWGRALRRRKL